MDALVFVVLGMIVGFCMADALHRLGRRAPREVALSMSGEHPYIVLPHDATREDVDAAHARLAASARATPANDMATGGHVLPEGASTGPTERQRVGIEPWPRTDGREMDAYLDVQRGNPRMMGN